MNIHFKSKGAKKALDRFIKIESAQVDSLNVSDFDLQYKNHADGVEFWIKARPQSTIKFDKKDVQLLRKLYRNKREGKP